MTMTSLPGSGHHECDHGFGICSDPVKNRTDTAGDRQGGLSVGRGHVVLDLFAGTGVGVAIKQLGATEYGVEIMKEACATREANGMQTLYNDVWDIDRAAGVWFDTLWASPPCQTFSMAGKGAGRKALDDVLGVVSSGLWRSMTDLRREADRLGDERIGLVLTPLHYVYRFSPTYVAFEQVPPVLPVWEAMAEQMRAMRYSVWTGYLNSEQYGVPQTRKRAYLIAKRDPDWEACPPAPTHSRYYPRTPEKLDSGVRPWVSMADALGGGAPFLVISNYGSGGDPANRGQRSSEEPSATLTSKFDRMKKEAA